MWIVLIACRILLSFFQKIIWFYDYLWHIHIEYVLPLKQILVGRDEHIKRPSHLAIVVPNIEHIDHIVQITKSNRLTIITSEEYSGSEAAKVQIFLKGSYPDCMLTAIRRGCTQVPEPYDFLI